MDTTALITILIAVIGCTIGLSDWLRNTKNDSGDIAAQITMLEKKIAHLEEQLSEIKADIKVTQNAMQKAIEASISAEAVANAVHDRLDTMYVKSAFESKQDNNK